ncbi:MAG: molybdopterin-dependent oxidoreductase [Chloroflexi bacterium]|nr:molybdopterin-dependent oxidoreductase [Chloroflexota bacterium]
MSAAGAGLDVYGDVTFGIPDRLRASYRTTTYFNTAPDEPLQRWLTVGADGRVRAFAGKVEYGQGVRSGFAMEVAAELRLPLEAVEVTLGDTELVPWDLGTFGSGSTAYVGLQLRRAAATARQALLDLAADRFDLPTSELHLADGRVVAGGDDARSLGYGELVSDAYRRAEIPEGEVELTAPGEFTVLGAERGRVDAMERVTGAAVYSRDVLLPGLLHAAVIRPPSLGAELTALDAGVAAQLPGVVRVVHEPAGPGRPLLAAVLAESDEQALRAADVVQARWEERPGQPSRWDVPGILLDSARDTMLMQESGDVEAGLEASVRTLEATYYAPYISIAPMEPRAATARWEDGRLTVWAGTQRPFGIRSELASYFELPEAQVRVIAPEIGGGFGGKSIYPLALEAARLARAAERPVRVAFSRTEETQHSTFRPAALVSIRSGVDAEGRLVAWGYEAIHAGERALIGRRGSESPYAAPHQRTVVSSADSPLPVGSYRSLGAAVNHFARESHVDEIAAAAGADPVEWRRRHLEDRRYHGVLDEAVRRFRWSPAAPASGARDGRGRGVAVGIDVGSYVALCVDVEVRGQEVRVERVSAAIDCGLAVNPDGVINQMEGGILQGLGGTLTEAVEFERGVVLNPGFARYRVPRIHNTPRVDVGIVGDPQLRSTGAGELGIVPIAAAVANAVYDATGQRIRELPLQRQLEAVG